MCGGSCCLVKSCCFGRDLGAGAIAWAVAEIVFLLCISPFPHLLNDIAHYSSYFIGWIVVLILANIILILGVKSGKPAFVMLWLIIYGLDLILSLILWILYLVAIILDLSGSSEVKVGFWELKSKTLEEIGNNTFRMVVFIVASVVLFIAPFFRLYFWLVVRSLRRRWIMEMSIGFDPTRDDIQGHKTDTVWDRLYEGRKATVRPQGY